MTTKAIQSPYNIYNDLTGQPLESGYIYVGELNLNPVTSTNQKTIYWDPELSIEAQQPVRTIGGYPSKNGSPGKLYCDGDYSIVIQDKNEGFVYSNLTSEVSNIESVKVKLLKTGNQSVVSATWTKVTFASEDFDTLDSFTSSTFTAPYTGYYSCKAQIATDSVLWAAGNTFAISFYKNGALSFVGPYSYIDAALTRYAIAAADTIFYLEEGDTIELYAFHNRGSNTSIGAYSPVTFVNSSSLNIFGLSE